MSYELNERSENCNKDCRLSRKRHSEPSVDIVIPGQATTAVYADQFGQIVIRQDASPHDDQDRFVVIDAVHAVTLVKAILREADCPELMLVPVRELEIVGEDGQRLVIPESELNKIAKISRDMRAEEREERQRRKDPTAAERKRRQRQRERDRPAGSAVDVTPRTVTETVTSAQVVPIEPRLFEGASR